MVYSQNGIKITFLSLSVHIKKSIKEAKLPYAIQRTSLANAAELVKQFEKACFTIQPVLY